MPNRRDLNQELFGGGIASAETPSKGPPREISLSELADLSELTEEQAKVRVKVTHLATQVEALTDSQERGDCRLDKHKSALVSAVTQVERLSSADDLHSQQLDTLSDSLRSLESHLEAHQNALAFLRNSDAPAAANYRAAEAIAHHADAHPAVWHLAVRGKCDRLGRRPSVQLPQTPEPHRIPFISLTYSGEQPNGLSTRPTPREADSN